MQTFAPRARALRHFVPRRLFARSRLARLTAPLALAFTVAAGGGCPAAEPEPPPVPPKTPGVLRVVCFGDSITGNRPRERYLGKYLKFSDLLQVMLEARLGFGKAEVLNSGWAGDATYPKKSQGFAGAVARLQQDVIALQPDLAVVLIGGNDKQKTAEDRALTLQNLTRITSDLKAAGIKTLLLQYPRALPDPQAPEKAWGQLADKNPLIAQAAQAAGLPVLDLGPPMQEALKTAARTDLVNAVDGSHLNPGGEIVYARAIFAKWLELDWLPPAK